MLLFCFFLYRFFFILRFRLCRKWFRGCVSTVLLAEIVHPLDLNLQIEGTVLIIVELVACAVKLSTSDLILPVLEVLTFKELLGMNHLVDIRGILNATHRFELLLDGAVAELEATREIHCLVRLIIRVLYEEVALVNFQGKDAYGISQVVL